MVAGTFLHAMTMPFLLSITFLVPSVAAIGCSNCLSESTDDIRFGCIQSCDKAFTSGTSENLACRNECTTFVFDQHCCTGSCLSSNQCLIPFFAYPMPSALAKRDVSGFADEDNAAAAAAKPGPGPAARRSTAAAAGLDSTVYWAAGHTAVWSLETDLKVRADPGSVCCKSAQAVLGAGAAKLAQAYAQITAGQTISDDDAVSGVVLISFGAAASFACSRVYQINCLFDGRVTPTPTTGAE